jgi:hypothetical protein
MSDRIMHLHAPLHGVERLIARDSVAHKPGARCRQRTAQTSMCAGCLVPRCLAPHGAGMKPSLSLERNQQLIDRLKEEDNFRMISTVLAVICNLTATL